MKALIAVMVLLLATTAMAQEEGQGGTLDSATSFIMGINPLVLIIAGVVLFFASNLAKLIAIVLVLVGAVSLIVSFL